MHVQTAESQLRLRRDYMALIQFVADCNETKCKRCGHRARIFYTYLEGAGCNSELTLYESRRQNRPGPCP